MPVIKDKHAAIEIRHSSQSCSSTGDEGKRNGVGNKGGGDCGLCRNERGRTSSLTSWQECFGEFDDLAKGS